MVKPESRCSFIIFVKKPLDLGCLVTKHNVPFLQMNCCVKSVNKLFYPSGDFEMLVHLRNGNRSKSELEQWAIDVDKTSN